MEKIVEKAETEKNELTADEWKELVASFEENEKVANEAAETGELSVADRMKLVTLTARWAAAAKTTLLDEIFSKINEALMPDETTADSAKEVFGDKR